MTRTKAQFSPLPPSGTATVLKYDASERAGGRTPRSEEAARGVDVTDVYLHELSSSTPLTREGEVEFGRRIESGETEAIDAWVRSPIALRELAALADDLQAGRVTLDDLLLNVDPDDSPEEPASVRLARLLALARSLSTTQDAGADLARARQDLAAGLADVRPGPLVEERIERALLDAAARSEEPERSEIDATLVAIRRGREIAARAKADLVKANLRLVVANARQYRYRGVPLLDLVQEGNLGLMRAADKFDYRRGHRFSTYAGWWIKQGIERALLYQGKVVKVPVHLADSRRKVLRARRALEQEKGREPTPDEIAERSGLSLEKVHMLRELSLDPIHLDAPIGEDGDAHYGDFLASEDVGPDEALAERRMVEQMREMLDSLLPRERQVLRLRYGLGGEQAHTLEEIGGMFSLTRERIRQIEAKALEKLRVRSQRRQIDTPLRG